MKVNIYYGGRGLIEDPTIYVMNKITEVLQELRVEVTRYNLYEEKSGITALPKTLKNADGVIFATTVEWYGIGGLMQQFLDACWLYSDKEYISNLCMMPVVMASTYGERDAELALIKSWEIIGGLVYDGLCAYVEDHIMFETNRDYMKIIEKKAENYYRTLSQKTKNLPTSNSAVKQNILRTTSLDLTPQESEQLSMYVSDDTYVKKQKEDIKELTDMFKELLWGGKENDEDFIADLKKQYTYNKDRGVVFCIKFIDKKETLVIDTTREKPNIFYGKVEKPDVLITTDEEKFSEIVCGNSSMQRAFMAGDITVKGNLDLLKIFDMSFEL